MSPINSDECFLLWVLLAQTRDKLYDVANKELKPYSLTPRKGAVLVAIKELGDKATLSRIALSLHRKPHSISELISRMERQGLVKKIKDNDKNNVTLVTLTQKGLKGYYDTLAIQCIPDIFGSIDGADAQKLRAMLSKIYQSAKAYRRGAVSTTQRTR